MAECQPSKLITRVRFPSDAPLFSDRKFDMDTKETIEQEIPQYVIDRAEWYAEQESKEKEQKAIQEYYKQFPSDSPTKNSKSTLG